MLGAAIAGGLPYAIASAASPIPVAAVILMLLARRGAAGLTFSLGRLTGYAVILALVIFASELIGRGLETERSVAGTVARLIAGFALLIAGTWTWLRRGRRGATGGLWRRVRALDRITPTTGAGVGFALSIGPKSLLMGTGGGLAIAGATVTPAGGVAAAVVFLAIAGSTVLVPVALYYGAGSRALTVLEPLEPWMETHAIAISAAALAAVGVVLIGTGLTGLL